MERISGISTVRPRWLFTGLSVLLLFLFFLDILSGSVYYPAVKVLDTLFSPAGADPTLRTIIHEFRIPKAITALLAGMALSVSGLQMQTVFRNPLAGPYVLGISSGASLAVALFAMGFPVLLSGGMTWTGTWTVALVAWTGSHITDLMKPDPRNFTRASEDALVRFLGLTGLADADWVQAHVRAPLPARQRLVRVTEAVVARSEAFRFLVPTVGLSVVARAGTPIAQDGDHVWRTPYDDTVLVMPGTNNLKPGGTAVRLGRFE